MAKELAKVYEPREVEDRIYQAWEESGCFHGICSRSSQYIRGSIFSTCHLAKAAIEKRCLSGGTGYIDRFFSATKYPINL